MDFEDQDAPPDLVVAGDDLSDEEMSVKVPITIVTGKDFDYNFRRIELSPFADVGIPMRQATLELARLRS